MCIAVTAHTVAPVSEPSNVPPAGSQPHTSLGSYPSRVAVRVPGAVTALEARAREGSAAANRKLGVPQCRSGGNAPNQRNQCSELPEGTLCRAEAPRFGRLRPPQLGAGLLRSGADLLLDAPRVALSTQSYQPGHLTQVGVCTSGPQVSGLGRARRAAARAASSRARRARDYSVACYSSGRVVCHDGRRAVSRCPVRPQPAAHRGCQSICEWTVLLSVYSAPSL